MENDILKQLLTEYDQKRINAEINLSKKMNELYNKYPDLLRINEEIKSCGIKLSKEIILGHNVENIKQELIRLKNNKKTLLNKLNISEDDLSPNYECKICKDTGYVVENNSKNLCSCIKQKLLNIKYNKSNMNNIYNENFNTFDLNFYSPDVNEEKFKSKLSPRENIKKIRNICYDFIKKFDDPKTNNLLFVGNSGLGKTFLSNCIAYELLQKEKTVLYQTASNMLDNIINYKFGKSSSFGDVYENILNVDLLIIDDLGTESTNSIKCEELFNIINSRLLNQTNNYFAKTIISTNLNLKELSEKYDERIVSRLIGSYDICRFFGDDIRLQKKRA